MSSILVLFLCGISLATWQGVGAVNVTSTSTGNLTTSGVAPVGTGPFSTTFAFNNNTSNSSDLEGCASYSAGGCGACTAHSTCLWCQSEETCVSGNLLHNTNICKDWRWKQCSIAGTYTLYGGIAIICVVFLIIVILCCCCCCCCSKKRKAASRRKVELEAADERESLIPRERETKTPRTDQRRQELMAKYGIKPKPGDFA